MYKLPWEANPWHGIRTKECDRGSLPGLPETLILSENLGTWPNPSLTWTQPPFQASAFLLHRLILTTCTSSQEAQDLLFSPLQLPALAQLLFSSTYLGTRDWDILQLKFVIPVKETDVQIVHFCSCAPLLGFLH